MGFNMNDIVSFMVSDAVSLVNDISSANMFDEYMYQTNVKEAIKILQGHFPLSKFFYGDLKKERSSDDYDDFDDYDNENDKDGSLQKEAYDSVRKSLQKALQEAGLVKRKLVPGKGKNDEKVEVVVPIEYGDKQFSKMLHDFYICKIQY